MLGTCGAGRPDGESATSVCMQNHSTTIGVDGDGGVTFADGRYLIRKVAPPLPGFDAEGLALPSSDGLEVYEFDRIGRHLRTRDGLTGAVHQDVRVRRRQAAGRHRRRLRQPHADRARRRGRGDGDRRPRRPAHDADDQRRRLPRERRRTRPARRTASPTTTGGLLASFKKPERRHDALRLRRRRAADAPPRRRRRGAHADPHRGRVRPDGDDQDRGRRRRPSTRWRCSPTATAAAPCRSRAAPRRSRSSRVDGLTELTAPDGTKTDGRVRARSALGQPRCRSSPTRPSRRRAARRTRTKRTRQRRAARPARPVLDQHAEDDVRHRRQDSSGLRTATAKPDDSVTQRSAEGRETVQTLDAHGRVLKQTLGTGVAPIEYAYDELGRPKSMKQGTRADDVRLRREVPARRAARTPPATRRRTSTTTPTG